MLFKVYLLRSHGRRLAWRDAQNSKTYTGTLVTHIEQHDSEQYRVLKLQPTDPMSEDRPLPLYEAQLLGFSPLAFRLRGYERIESGPEQIGVVQEWHCELP